MRTGINLEIIVLGIIVKLRIIQNLQLIFWETKNFGTLVFFGVSLCRSGFSDVKEKNLKLSTET